MLEQAYKFSYDNMQLLKIEFNIIDRKREKNNTYNQKRKGEKNTHLKLELMFMKHYAPNRCLYIKVAKLRTGLGSAEMSHLQNCSPLGGGGGGGGGVGWGGGGGVSGWM